MMFPSVPGQEGWNIKIKDLENSHAYYCGDSDLLFLRFTFDKDNETVVLGAVTYHE
jgi:hypothetical protein